MPRNSPLDSSSDLLLLAKRFPPRAGGVAQYSVQVARAYARTGMSVVALTQAESAAGWDVDEETDRLHTLNVGPGSQPVAFAKFLVWAFRLRRQHFRLVHATTWKMAIIALVVMPRTPLIVTVHGREALNVSKLAMPIFRRVLAKADRVYAVSQATMDAAIEAVGPSSRRYRWAVRYNGITFTEEEVERALSSREPSSRVEVLSLCRMVPRKNIGAALRSLAEVQGDGDAPVHLSIAGTGPERSALEELTRDLGIESHVDFLGFVPDEAVPDLYAAADVFIHPHTHVGEGNDFEGFGITIADAMSFGCAVIVGDAGGPAELVDHEVNGLMIDGLDGSAVTESLRALVSDPDLRRRLGAAARTSARERFSWDRHIEPGLSLVGGK